MCGDLDSKCQNRSSLLHWRAARETVIYTRTRTRAHIYSTAVQRMCYTRRKAVRRALDGTEIGNACSELWNLSLVRHLRCKL